MPGLVKVELLSWEVEVVEEAEELEVVGELIVILTVCGDSWLPRLSVDITCKVVIPGEEIIIGLV